MTILTVNRRRFLMTGAAAGAAPTEPARPSGEPAVPTVGRNEPCPCGSGQKYKHCHGRVA